MAETSYAIALGSNRRHGRHGAPEKVIAAALDALAATLTVESVSPIQRTPALGPAGRAFANAAAIVSTTLDPPGLLALLKQTERDFGRRRGRRWGPRVLDLDIILWSEGSWVSSELVVPHVAFRSRRFVLDPLAAIAPRWRDPITGLSIAHLRARAVDRRRLRS